MLVHIESRRLSTPLTVAQPPLVKRPRMRVATVVMLMAPLATGAMLDQARGLNRSKQPELIQRASACRNRAVRVQSEALRVVYAMHRRLHLHLLAHFTVVCPAAAARTEHHSSYSQCVPCRVSLLQHACRRTFRRRIALNVLVHSGATLFCQIAPETILPAVGKCRVGRQWRPACVLILLPELVAVSAVGMLLFAQVPWASGPACCASGAAAQFNNPGIYMWV